LNYSQREKIFSHDKNLRACCYSTAEDFISESIDSDEEFCRLVKLPVFHLLALLQNNLEFEFIYLFD
jgi:hypothetical protein